MTSKQLDFDVDGSVAPIPSAVTRPQHTDTLDTLSEEDADEEIDTDNALLEDGVDEPIETDDNADDIASTIVVGPLLVNELQYTFPCAGLIFADAASKSTVCYQGGVGVESCRGAIRS